MTQTYVAPTLDLTAAADFATRAAQESGRIALDWFRQPMAIDIKSDLSPVSEADRAVEADLRRRIAAAYPTHAILGEEFGAQGPSGAPTWAIDPIDGTRSFITGWPIWGTLVALTVQRRARIGVIHLPVLDETWTAIEGRGCWFTGRDGRRQACHASRCTELSTARFYTTSPDYFDLTEQPAYQAIARSAAIQRFGGDCYIYGLLASGHIDLVLESRLQPYDYLSLVPVIEEAGGIISDWEGRPLTLDSGDQAIAAATPELHRQALDLIAASRAGPATGK